MAVTDKKKHEYIRIHLWLRPVTTVPYRLKINQKIWYKKSHKYNISEVTQNESTTLSPYWGHQTPPRQHLVAPKTSPDWWLQSFWWQLVAFLSTVVILGQIVKHLVWNCDQLFCFGLILDLPIQSIYRFSTQGGRSCDFGNMRKKSFCRKFANTRPTK